MGVGCMCMLVQVFSLRPKAPQLSETLEAPSGIVGVRTSTCSLLVPAGCVFYSGTKCVCVQRNRVH